MITREEAAAQLNGCEYRQEGSRELWAQMKAAGLVAVYGASDDLVELAGAIDEELGGSTFYLSRKGLLINDCDDDACPAWKRRQDDAEEAGAVIDPIWDRDGFSWVYDTEIPHSTFEVLEEGETYCRGIVFALADVPVAAPSNLPLDRWDEWSKRDDWHQQFVGSDIRQMLGEIRRLQAR